MAQDANLFQKIGTRLHERLTNAFSQKIEHSLNCKISIATAGIQSPWGSFQGIFFNQILNYSCIISNFV